MAKAYEQCCYRLKRNVMNRIKKGDQVVVIAGKDKGKRGDVLRVAGDQRVVSNVNIIKRHTKPNPQAGQAGGMVEREAPIHISNVMLFNPATGKGERVGFKVLEDGRKLRVFRSSGEALDGPEECSHDPSGKVLQGRRRAEADGAVRLRQPMQVPRMTKITLNMGVGEAAGNKKILENAVADMAKITGQKPIVTKSRVSVASFKIRDGWPIGCKVTLRRAKMYEFLDRLVNISLPRVRDFRGVSGRSFDGRGNYNMGVKEQIIFPEIDFDQVDAMRGMDIAITTTAKTDAEAKALLEAFSFPFRN